MNYEFTKKIVCLFCNKPIAVISDIMINSYNCTGCKTHYYLSEEKVHMFTVQLDNLTIYFLLDQDKCLIFQNNSDRLLPLNISIDKLLLPIPKLKEKINNILAYL